MKRMPASLPKALPSNRRTAWSMILRFSESSSHRLTSRIILLAITCRSSFTSRRFPSRAGTGRWWMRSMQAQVSIRPVGVWMIHCASSGTAMLTSSGHIYALRTRIYSAEVFRRQQTFHSASHPAGNGYGGTLASADVRIVLEVHDVDPTNPATAVAPSTVLYDSLISGAPGFCSYVLVNAANLNSSIAFTRILQAVDAEVRSTLPNGSYRTRLVGPLSDGAECKILSSPALEFFPKYAPASGELIEVRYRGYGRAV